MKLISWNVNGLRAAERKGFVQYALDCRADMICLQEIKALPEQLSPTLHHIDGYQAWFNSAERKGYSGTAIYSLKKPNGVTHGLGIPEFDREGRVQIADFPDFLLYNIYYPNGKASAQRLDFKMRFYEAFHAHVLEQKKQGPFHCRLRRCQYSAHADRFGAAGRKRAYIWFFASGAGFP